MDTRFSSAIHTLILIAGAEKPLTSDQIAKSVGTNASYIRRITGLERRVGRPAPGPASQTFVPMQVGAHIPRTIRRGAPPRTPKAAPFFHRPPPHSPRVRSLTEEMTLSFCCGGEPMPLGIIEGERKGIPIPYVRYFVF